MLLLAFLFLPSAFSLLLTDLFSVLPHFNAFLNASSFVLLSSGYFFIRRKKVKAHRNCQIAALSASVLFLVSYVVYHQHHGVTRFVGQGIARPIYFTILTTHTLLAVVIVPFVIVTVLRARRGDFSRHKRIARWTLPLWLYVSITGVIVYFMLYHLYPTP
jgi:putative membrane protein